MNNEGEWQVKPTLASLTAESRAGLADVAEAFRIAAPSVLAYAVAAFGPFR